MLAMGMANPDRMIAGTRTTLLLYTRQSAEWCWHRRHCEDDLHGSTAGATPLSSEVFPEMNDPIYLACL